MSDSPRVALVNMPFSSSKYPSIQLGTLAALLKAQGIGVKTYHLYLRFAYQIGQPLYEVLCEKRGLLGEWLFSHLLFRDNPFQTHLRVGGPRDRLCPVVPRRAEAAMGSAIPDADAD